METTIDQKPLFTLKSTNQEILSNVQCLEAVKAITNREILKDRPFESDYEDFLLRLAFGSTVKIGAIRIKNSSTARYAQFASVVTIFKDNGQIDKKISIIPFSPIFADKENDYIDPIDPIDPIDNEPFIDLKYDFTLNGFTGLVFQYLFSDTTISFYEAETVDPLTDNL